jgi:hypothetical protein
MTLLAVNDLVEIGDAAYVYSKYNKAGKKVFIEMWKDYNEKHREQQKGLIEDALYQVRSEIDLRRR